MITIDDLSAGNGIDITGPMFWDRPALSPEAALDLNSVASCQSAEEGSIVVTVERFRGSAIFHPDHEVKDRAIILGEQIVGLG